MIMYFCSDGTRVSQATIDRRYSESLKNKYAFAGAAPMCDGCRKRPSVHSDHTISRARCKVIHKTELIWHPGNYVRSCEECHRGWENIKGLAWVEHLNVEERLLFLKKNDPEGYQLRMNIAA